MNFGSRLYQLNRLFLLALKVDHAVEFGLGELQAGRKPVFVLEHTLETLLREVITNRFDDRSDAPGDDDPPERPAAPDPQPTTTRLPLEDAAPEPARRTLRPTPIPPSTSAMRCNGCWTG